MQTKMEGNRIRFSKSFDEATPEAIDRAEKHGWYVEINGGEQMVYFSKEVKQNGNNTVRSKRR